jgi:hypothetical protein
MAINANQAFAHITGSIVLSLLYLDEKLIII